VIIPVPSSKYGVQEVRIDVEDYRRIEDLTIYIWGTPRHKTLYARVQLAKGKCQTLHRFLLDSPKGIIDHVNGNGLDNRKANLRLTNATGNNQNCRKRAGTSSKYKGIHFSSKENKFKAQIQVNKKKLSLGTYKNEIEAALAYDRAAIAYFGEFANLNFPKDEK
jgi:hypothetical protein